MLLPVAGFISAASGPGVPLPASLVIRSRMPLLSEIVEDGCARPVARGRASRMAAKRTVNKTPRAAGTFKPGSVRGRRFNKTLSFRGAARIMSWNGGHSMKTLLLGLAIAAGASVVLGAGAPAPTIGKV